MADKDNSAAFTPQTVTILDRKIVVQPIVSLGLDRMRLMAQIGYRLSKGKASLDDMLRLDRIIELLLSEEDNSWLEDQVVEGKLRTEEVLNALMPAFEAMRATDKTAEPVKPARKATRGR